MLAALAMSAWGATHARADEPATRPIAAAVIARDARCFDAPKLGAAIARWLGRDAIDARLSIDASDDGGQAKFTLRRDGQVVGSRALAVPGAACEDVRAALGLAIAVALDATVLATANIADAPASSGASGGGAPAAGEPSSAAAERSSSGASGAAAATIAGAPSGPSGAVGSAGALPPGAMPLAPGPAPPATARSAAGASVSRPQRLTIAAGAGLGVDVLTSPAFVGAAAAEWLFLPRLFVRAGLLATSSVSAQVAGGGATLQLVAGAADACTRGTLGPVDGRACLGAALGALSAHGYGFARSYDAAGPWLAITARVGARWRVGERFGLDLDAAALAPPYRVHLDVVTAGATTATLPLPLAGVMVSAGPSLLLW
jgi:hypothetical protein